MTALFTALYALALLSQMYAISIYLPTRVVEAAAEENQSELHERPVDSHRVQQYLSRNRFIAVVGLAPVLVAWLADFESQLTLILLTTGLFFFLQVAALIADREVRSLLSVSRGSTQRASRPLVITAVVAYAGYVAASMIYQNEAATTQLAKLQVVTLANLVIVFTVAAHLISVRRTSSEESRTRRGEVDRTINVLATISIGVSVYFIGKDVLADLDLAGLRPLMMSAFLQALMLFTVHAQLGTRPFRRVPGRIR